MADDNNKKLEQEITQPHNNFFAGSMQDIRIAKSFFEQHLPESIQKKIGSMKN